MFKVYYQPKTIRQAIQFFMLEVAPHLYQLYNIKVNLLGVANLCDAGCLCKLWSSEPKEGTGDGMNPMKNTKEKT